MASFWDTLWEVVQKSLFNGKTPFSGNQAGTDAFGWNQSGQTPFGWNRAGAVAPGALGGRAPMGSASPPVIPAMQGAPADPWPTDFGSVAASASAAPTGAYQAGVDAGAVSIAGAADAAGAAGGLGAAGAGAAEAAGASGAGEYGAALSAIPAVMDLMTPARTQSKGGANAQVASEREDFNSLLNAALSYVSFGGYSGDTSHLAKKREAKKAAMKASGGLELPQPMGRLYSGTASTAPWQQLADIYR